MRRREFIALLGSAAAWPVRATAQQREQVRRIGILLPATADDPVFQARLAAFYQELALLGWSIGRNVRIEPHWATANASEIRKHAMELAELAPDVILATGDSTVPPLLQEDTYDSNRFSAFRRSGRRRVRRQLGTPGRQCHRLYVVRVHYWWEMAGVAQRDRAKHHTSSGSSGSR